MRNRLTACLIVGLTVGMVGIAVAEDADPTAPGPWTYGTTFGLNTTQSSFSRNWSGGDVGSIVWVLNSDMTAERQFSRTFNLKNRLELAYGQTSRQMRDTADAAEAAALSTGQPLDLVWDRPEKTTDLIKFESFGRFSLDAYVDPYFSVGAVTQFNDASDPVGNILFNPIKIKETAGIARVIEKTETSELITRFGFGFRQTLGRTIVDAATLEKESFVSNDGGFEWQTEATRPILGGKVLYKGTLLLFQPVFYSESSDLEAIVARAAAVDSLPSDAGDYWKATDVNFQNTFTAEITKYLQVNLIVQWVYDKFDTKANVDPSRPLSNQIVEIGRNIRKRGQFRQTLALGLTYRLF